MNLILYVKLIVESSIAFSCVVMMGYTCFTRKKDPETARILIGVLVTDALYNIADVLAYYYDGNETQIGDYILRASNLLLFVSMYLFVFYITAYINRILEKRSGRKKPVGRLLPVIYTLCFAGITLMIISRLAGFYYGFDDQNRYYRMDSFAIHAILLNIIAVLDFIVILRNRKTFHIREYRAFMVLMGASIILPAIQLLYGSVILYDMVSLVGLVTTVVVYLWEISDYTVYRTYTALTAVNIDGISEEIERFMKRLGKETNRIYRVRLKIEETLLRFRDKFGEDVEVTLITGISFRRPTIRISLEGEPYNPLINREQDIDNWSMGLLESTGINPRYVYAAGKNVIRLPLPPIQLNPAVKIVMILVAGVALGMISESLLNEEALDLLNKTVFELAYNLLIDILYCTAGPIIFFMVIDTILSVGTISHQGLRTKSIVGRFLIISGLWGLSTSWLMLRITNTSPVTDHVSKERALELAEAIRNFIPKSIFDPIIQANTPQLLLMSIVIGFAVLSIGKRENMTYDFLRHANLVGMRLARWISGIIPVFLIFVIAYVVVDDQKGEFLALANILVASALISLAWACIYMLYISGTQKIKPGKLMKKCWPSLRRALIAGSTEVSYDDSEACCIKELGIRRNLVTEILPLGTTLFMPANTIGVIVFLSYASTHSDIQITLIWLVQAVVLSVLLIVATPPIPGANFLAYMVIISMLGIDSWHLPIAMIFDILYAPISSAVNQFTLQMDMIAQAEMMGMVKRETLRS